MSIKLPDIDGEWEVDREAFDKEASDIFRLYKRIQPPAPKALYKKLCRKWLIIGPDEAGLKTPHFEFFCDRIEALERKLEDEKTILDRRIHMRDEHIARMQDKLKAIERACELWASTKSPSLAGLILEGLKK